MQRGKTMALVAHDNCEQDLVDWVRWNYSTLIQHRIVCTGTTGLLVERASRAKVEEEGGEPERVQVHKLRSGPLGGDQQLGALVTEGKVHFIIFFWDPMQPHPHDVDVKALLRIAVVYNIPIACNRATADFMISSPLMTQEYCRARTDYSAYINRTIVPPDETLRREPWLETIP